MKGAEKRRMKLEGKGNPTFVVQNHEKEVVKERKEKRESGKREK